MFKMFTGLTNYVIIKLENQQGFSCAKGKNKKPLKGKGGFS